MTITINGTGTLTGVSVGGLPDGIVDTDMIAANAVTAAKASGSAKGITMADHWRLHTSQNGGASASNVDLTNWERVDTSPQGGFIGSAMTVSSGVFTFPSTGVYLVRASGTFHDGGSNMHYARFSMFATTNNSSYSTIAEGYSSSLTTTQGFQTCYMESLIDVTDTSNVKLKFGFSGLYDVYCMGETTANRTAITFVKLGDT